MLSEFGANLSANFHSIHREAGTEIEKAPFSVCIFTKWYFDIYFEKKKELTGVLGVF